jgi:hypothetical protein
MAWRTDVTMSCSLHELYKMLRWPIKPLLQCLPIGTAKGEDNMEASSNSDINIRSFCWANNEY